MAIEKTATLNSISVQPSTTRTMPDGEEEVYPASIIVHESVIFDDPDDDELPQSTGTSRAYRGTEENLGLADEDQVVQDIAAVVLEPYDN